MGLKVHRNKETVYLNSVVTNPNIRVIECLEEFWDSGSLTPDEWLNQQRCRMVICEKHVTIYKQIGMVVYICHIADTQTNYTKLFY